MKKFDKVDWLVILAAGALLWMFFPKSAPAPAPGTKVSSSQTETKPDGAAATPAASADPVKPAAPGETPAAPPVDAKEVTLKNDAGEFTFSSLGGGIKTANLFEAPFAGKTRQLLNSHGRAAIGSLARGVAELDKTNWAIKAQTDRSISFEAIINGVTVTKLWTMKDGDPAVDGPGYMWDLQLTFANPGAEPFVTEDFYIYTGASNQLNKADGLYIKGVYFNDGKSTEVGKGDFDASRRLWILWETRPARDPVKESFGTLNWAGVNSQYYAQLITPKEKTGGQLWMKHFEDKELRVDGQAVSGAHCLELGLGLGQVKVEPNSSTTRSYEVFLGPRSATLLGKIDNNLKEGIRSEERKEAMFYGITGPLSRMFLWLLNIFNGWAASFGIAIILLTIVVRLCIWPLHIKATRSMKRMGLLAPMMTEIKERYKAKPQNPDNQRKQQVEMMGLYREYNVSPLGGCIPLLLQMPIFFGYFGMLNHAVEMRGHSFLWAHDLTAPDTVFTLPLGLFNLPINPLPLIMTATMYIQMKLTPMQQPSMSTGSDAMAQQMALQMKLFKFMPVMFLFFCYFNASALALYWTVQNIVSILQTYVQKLFPEPVLEKRAVKKLPPISGSDGGMAGFGMGGGKPPKDKGPKQIGPGGSAKSAYKKDK